ncbi:hypothetical protein [Flavobacterium sp. 9R]|uniref:hypothetical protein n=1 Tax=Flavobacterium sp. 9R TaxID=2653143 RepID=UPI00135A16F5|nr:hypothetical protein [Flavobacterium sp. 9R]
MTFKKILLTTVFTILLIYLVSLVVLLISSGGPTNYWQAFNPIYQHETWLFVFGWSLGNWGYALMVVLWLLLFTVVYQFVNKTFFKN